MKEPFTITAMIHGKPTELSVVPQEENFIIISDNKQVLSMCFNCDYECTCMKVSDIDKESFESISNAIDLYYMLRH